MASAWLVTVATSSLYMHWNKSIRKHRKAWTKWYKASRLVGCTCSSLQSSFGFPLCFPQVADLPFSLLCDKLERFLIIAPICSVYLCNIRSICFPERSLPSPEVP